MPTYQVSLRVAGHTLDGVIATAASACEDFFGTVEYTSVMNYVQAVTDSDEPYDVDGKPKMFLADVQATATTPDP